MKIQKLLVEGLNIAKKLCLPSVIYLILSALTVLGMIASFSFVWDPVGFLGQVAWTGLWTYVLNDICKRGHEGLSWFLLLLPVIIGALVLFGIGGAAVYAIDHDNDGEEGFFAPRPQNKFYM